MAADGCIRCPKAYLFFYLVRCRLSFPCPPDLLTIPNGSQCPLGIYIRLLWTLRANNRILGPPGNYPFRMQGVVLPWHRGRGERVPTRPCCQDSQLPEQAPGFRDRNDTFFHPIIHCFHTLNLAQCTASVTDRLRPRLSPSRHTHSAIPLSLSRLEGCPSYILSLLRYADISNNLEYLGLWLGRSSLSDFFISDVLSCTEHFPALQDLFVHIPIGTDTCALAFPKHFQACFVKYLMLHIQDSDILVRSFTCPLFPAEESFSHIVHSGYPLSRP